MKLSEVSIRRPVFATVMSLVVVLFGIIAMGRLPVREYPDIDPPIVSVTTFYRGASPQVVETEITDLLEENLATVEGIRTMTSSSLEQGSVVTMEFELDRDVDEAANDVRDKVSRIRGSLPSEAEDPIVSKVDANAQPIIWIALSSDVHDGLELSDVADRMLKERLQRLPGVGSVFIGGERRYAMRVWLDPMRMAARELTVEDVERAIRTANAEIPGGRVEGPSREFAVRTRGELAEPSAFGEIIIRQTADDKIRLRDVAEVRLGAEDERTVARFNGRPAVGLGIVKQSRSSTVDVSHEIHRVLPELSAELPEGMRLDIAYDSAEFIEASIHEVTETLIIAMCLVILVILVFLKSFRATVIPAVAIPVSLFGAVAVAFFLGYTINILTLLALVLAIGLVVDDAIIVLENVYRHMEMGKDRRRASFDGAKEIGFAVVSTTISLLAVFVPVSFLTGNIGRLFSEFGISVAVAVFFSGFVALTLSPMLTSKMLRPLHGTKNNWANRSFDAFFDWLNRIYGRTLEFSVKRWPVILGGAVLILAFIVVVIQQGILPEELVPIEDRGVAFGVVIAPEGATLEYTDRYMREVEARLLPLPERKGLFTAVGLGFGGPGRVTNGFFFLGLKPAEERERSQQEVVGSLFPQLFSIPGVLAFVFNPPSLGSRGSANPVEYVLLGDSYEELGQAVGMMMQEASQLGYLVNLDTDLRLNKPQLDVAIDRERAAGLGVSVEDIGSTLEALLGGRVVSDFKRGAKQYDVIVQVAPTGRATPEAIGEIYVRGDGGLVQLANVVDVTETTAPKELNHYNRVRSATITAALPPGVSLGTALDALDGIAENLPPGIRTDLAGQSREFRESSNTLVFLFFMAVVFIYLVLAAQFESFLHPFTILLSVPLAIFGALLSLLVFGETLNIFSKIGLIMLIGLTTKNSILIVEFANQLRERGLEVREAVIEAAKIRLRPILMTSFATIFGVLPIAIGFGAGAESRRPLGIAVVGGMVFSTFLTLVLVPVVYALISKFTRFRPETDEETGAEAAERDREAREAAARAGRPLPAGAHGRMGEATGGAR